jgi:hypothetical protein
MNKDNKLIWESWEASPRAKEKAYRAGLKDGKSGEPMGEVSDTWGPAGDSYVKGFREGEKSGGGFRPSNGAHLEPIKRKDYSDEIVDMVQYFRSSQGQTSWEDFKHYVEMGDSDWSNTMAYLMTGKGPGDYGDRLD